MTNEDKRTIEAVVPEWFAHALERELDELLRERGYARIVEDSGEVGGLEVTQWVRGEFDAPDREAIGFSARAHGDGMVLLELHCQPEKARAIAAIATLRLLRRCAGMMSDLFAELHGVLSDVLEKVALAQEQLEQTAQR